MINDLTNFDEMNRTFEVYFLPLCRMIEERGGYVAWSVVLRPDVLKQEAYDDSQCDWIPEYFGPSYRSWGQVADRAAELTSKQVQGLPITESMTKLRNNMARMNKKKTLPIVQNLAEDISVVGRFRRALETCLVAESSIYRFDTTDPTGLAHYLDYIYKYSPLSIYLPELYLNNLRGYGETRKIELSKRDLEIIADCVVFYQKQLGVLDSIGKMDPLPLDQTQIVALENNPTSAYSLPTMANAKDKDARSEALKLADMYRKNPKKYGNIPNVQNLRIQQGGNVLHQLIKMNEPDFNPATDWPTLQQFDDAMVTAWRTRPPLRRYVAKSPVDYNPSYMSLERLPNTLGEREALVRAGEHDDCILDQYKDGSFKFHFLLLEANPWKLVAEKLGEGTTVSQPTLDEIFNKNRVVFAAPAPVTLNSQSFIHVTMDYHKEKAISNGHAHLVAQWKEPIYLLRALTNLWAAVNNQPDADKVIAQLTDEERRLCGFLTGDDKSSFDNYQSIVLHQLFNACMIAPLFKPEYHELYRWCSMASLCPRILTSWGEFRFSEAMPSGHGTTNYQDTFISFIAGCLDVCDRAKVRPQVLFDLWQKLKAGLLAQGDDFESHDVYDPDGERKEANAAKLGLVLEASKSLMSSKCLEFTRRYSNGEWRYNYVEEGADILCLHAPIMHALVKSDFSEHPVKNPMAVASIAEISRKGNYVFHPNAIEIIQRTVESDPLKCGTKPIQYVPAWLLKEWREAGEPKPPSKYHVLIDSPSKLYSVAGREAQEQGDSIDHMVAGWRASTDADIDFEEQIIVKILHAMAKGDNNALEQFRRRVHSV